MNSHLVDYAHGFPFFRERKKILPLQITGVQESVVQAPPDSRDRDGVVLRHVVRILQIVVS